MTLDNFLTLLRKQGASNVKGAVGNRSVAKLHAYVEYMPLDSIDMSPLYDKLMNVSWSSCSRETRKYPGFPDWVSSLTNGKPYLWLGDGLTTGKMHFDPFDNLLLQVNVY